MWRSQFCFICWATKKALYSGFQSSSISKHRTQSYKWQSVDKWGTLQRINGTHIDNWQLLVAKPLLSNEQIQQFITSTVLPTGRSVASTETVNPNVTNCTVYPSQPGNRIQQQTDFTNVQPQLILNELRSGQTLPWVSIQQPSQETKQQLVLNSQGYIHPSDQSTFAVQILNPTLTQAELQQPISATELILPTSFETQGSTPTIVTDGWVYGTRLQVPTNILSVPSATGVYNQTIQLPQQTVHEVSSNFYYNGVYSPVITPTPNVTTPGPSAEYPQRSSAKLKSWSLQPQSVPAFVAPVEAQTKSKPKKSKEKIPKNVSQVQYVSANKHLTSKSTMSKGSRKLDKNNAIPMQQSVGKPMDVTLHQTENSVQTSVTQKGGKKGVKRIVVPPKAQTDSVEYPPYVARIMRILNRQKQGQVESADGKKETESDVFTSKQMTSVGKKDTSRADSTHKQATSTADKKATDTVGLSPKQSVVDRTLVSSKPSVLEQKVTV
ncbi:uncharacterized protein LOC134272469 [Saccostrea cucullata]|uniref:uncharacterized protein LOC134272469 n=1 Tax=Saccostrea cuccullata TaxID=36930 RepID=UPI002ED08F55